MSSLPVFGGLDYHQDSVQVCVLDAEGKTLINRRVSNDAEKVIAALCRHGKPRRLAIEACCGAADLAEELVTRGGLCVELAHPGYVARLKRGPDKTDLGDARLLADLSRVGYVPRVWLAPEETRQLRRLVRHRTQLVDRRRDLKLRIRAVLRENRLKPTGLKSAWTKAWLAWLNNEAALSPLDRWIVQEHLAELAGLQRRIREAEATLTKTTADDPVVQKLLSLAGVGLVTAGTMRAEIGRFDRFTRGKQLARFCGLSPCNSSSGQRQADAGLVKAGNPQLRAVLIELGHRLIRQLDGHWAALGARLLLSGKRRNVVVAAVANRWVRWLHHEMQRPIAPAEAPRPSGTKRRKQSPGG